MSLRAVAYGMVLLVYMVIEQNKDSAYQIALTEDVARDKNDIDKLFEKATGTTSADFLFTLRKRMRKYETYI